MLNNMLGGQEAVMPWFRESSANSDQYGFVYMRPRAIGNMDFWVLIEHCFKETAMKYVDYSIKLSPYRRAWNNFPAGAGQVVRSNLFLLGHHPFLAGQISITPYLYKIPPLPLQHDVYISNKYIF